MFLLTRVKEKKTFSVQQVIVHEVKWIGIATVRPLRSEMAPGYTVLHSSIGCLRSNSLEFLLSLETQFLVVKLHMGLSWICSPLQSEQMFGHAGGVTVCAPPSESTWG